MLKLKWTVAMLLIAFLMFSPLVTLPVWSSYTSKLYPTQDSWVEAEYPNDNHGYDTSLRVKSDSRTRRSYLKFDLSSVPNGKTITSVKLYLYCTYADANPSVQVYVHETDDSWDEASVTWNNAPAVGSLITSIPVGGTGQYYCWDVTPYGQTQYSGDKILSVVVKLLLDDPTQNNPNLARYFASKENTGTSQDPYLEVIYDNTPPTASFAYSPTYPVDNDTVTFDASASYDPDGSITTYRWDFGDGNTTTVTTPVIDHVYLMYGNYTVTVTVTDNDGLTDSETQIVEVVDPAILRVSLPEGVYVKQNTGDPWIDEGWLLNRTGNSWSFTLKISDTSNCLQSDDTHLIVALNNASYSNLQSLTINGTSIPKAAFQYGKPKPYGTKYWPNGCVYPAWFNDTYINVGTILPKGYVILTVTVTFSNAANARMHFDAYGHICFPTSWSQVTWSPNSEDSTVLYQAGPLPISVTINPTSATIDLGQQIMFTSTVSGGTTPYTYHWYLNGALVGTNSSSWTFIPSSTGTYQVYLNVTDNAGKEAKSNVAPVTVNSALSVSIQPASSVTTIGGSVFFTSSVSGGTTPYSYQWYVDDVVVSGANSANWTFTPSSTGFYQVSLKVTDAASAAKLSNDGNVTVNPKTYTLTITTTTGGTTTPVPGTYTYNEGTNVQVTATPDANYKLAYWELNGNNVGSTNPITITMNASYTLKAYFALITYTLTITATSGGTTNPAPGTYTYSSGQYANVQANPSANYFFDHWVLDGSNNGSTNPISVYMNKNHTLQAVFSLINCSLTITASAGGTTSPAPSTYIYANGSSVQVTALPAVNYKFVKWQLNGSDSGSSNPYTIVMDANYTLYAVFQQLTYRLTIVSSTGGSTTPGPGIYVYVNGTLASVTATPDAEYVLDYWLLDGNKAGSANPFTVLMMDDHALQPVFTKINYTLTISTTTGGTTSPVPGTYTYPSGSYASVTALPSANYFLDYWLLDGSNAGSTNPASILMNKDHSLKAVFSLINYTLTITTSTGGSTNPASGTYTYVNGTNVSVTAVPDTYYVLDYWLLDGSKAGSANPINVLMTSNHNLQPIFAHINYTLTVSSTTGGTTNPVSGTHTYSAGVTVGVTATPSAGYRFDHWVLDGSNNGTNPISVFMDKDHNLQAVFVETHTLIILVSEGGTTNPAPGTYNYDNPTDVTVTAIPNANYRFDHWVYDNVNNGSANPITVHVGSGHTLQAVFTLITYTLTIQTTTGGTTSPVPGTYTYTVGTNVQVTATPSAGYVFDVWQLNGVNKTSTLSYTVLMDQDYTLKALFKSTPPPPTFSVSIIPTFTTILKGNPVTFTPTINGGTSPYSYQWYLNGNPVSGATGSSWTFTPASSGTYHVYLKVTDSGSHVAISNEATVDVPGEGGYSVSLVKLTPASQVAAYTALLAFFGAALSLTKRKRK